MASGTAEAVDSSRHASEAHRRRLLLGLAAALQEKSLADVRIADVVARANVSKRTFYEQFTDKDECFLALYRASVRAGVASVEAAATADGPWELRLRAAVTAYLDFLQTQPALTRVHFLDVFAVGERGLAARRSALDRYADAIERVLADADDLPFPAPSRTTLVALVGGMNELALQGVERGQAAQLVQTVGPGAVDFAWRTLVGTPAPKPVRSVRKRSGTTS